MFLHMTRGGTNFTLGKDIGVITYVCNRYTGYLISSSKVKVLAWPLDSQFFFGGMER